MAGTKSDLINEAYSRMRVSGLTRVPDGEDIRTALRRLENMAAIWGETYCTGYNFEDTPDPGSLHNLKRKYWSAYESNLALLLLSDFGKQPAPSLVTEAQGTFAMLASFASNTTQILPPSRMPIGSGNELRYGGSQRFYRNVQSAPNDCETIQMIQDDVNIFTEHFDAYLGIAETISSYTIASSAPSNLVVSADSLTSPDITYTVTAPTVGTFYIRINATTSLGRVTSRKINFIVTEL